VRPDLAFLLALLASGTGLDQASAQGTANGSVNVGMMTMHSGPYPEMPSSFMLECDRPSGIAPYEWGHYDTVRVAGRVDTPTPRLK
jgi:hypothetical protein